MLINRTGRKKIIQNQGKEVKIMTKKNHESVTVDVQLNLDKNFYNNKNFAVKLQAYEKQGQSFLPWDLGAAQKNLEGLEDNIGHQFTLNDVEIDNLLFRLKVIDNKNTVIGLADSIKTFQEPGESGGGSKDTDTLLILREKNIQLPFKIEMEKDQKPVLVLQEKIRLKQLFKHNIQIKVLIYTAAIRDILKTYLSDTEFKDCEYKTKFIEKIQQICGGDLNDPPDYQNDDGTVNEEALNWINESISLIFSNPIKKGGKNIIYMNEFEKICKNLGDEEQDED